MKGNESESGEIVFSWSRFFGHLSLLLVVLVSSGFLLYRYLDRPVALALPLPAEGGIPVSVGGLDEILENGWASRSLEVAPDADILTLARRLSLGLTGAIPSLEEIRRIEKTPRTEQLDAWLNYLFESDRYAHYMAERFARVYVGVENGPFLVYRRRRLVNWIAGELKANAPYDRMARELIASKGIWTTSPAANFITVTQSEGGNDGPDEIKLAARTSRAFLGVSLDCVQCHDDKFGPRWKQEDFHQLAAYFASSEIGVSGVWDNPDRDYETRLRGSAEAEPVSMLVPFQRELEPGIDEVESPRDRLAAWITHRENRSFSRAVANRAWAVLFGRPLVEPIDDIPIEGEVDPVLEYLADRLVESDFDLQALFRLIAHSRSFSRESSTGKSGVPVTAEQEQTWAAFPMTQLRPEQVSGAIIQSASLQTIDSSSHILSRVARLIQTGEFVKRYGDKGESEYVEGTGTIPQRLLLMNGKLVDERSAPNPLGNGSSRISILSGDSALAVENAFLAVLTRKPSDAELDYFANELSGLKGKQHQIGLQDLYWVLLNSTEFSWNR